MNEAQAVEKIKVMLQSGPVETTLDDSRVADLAPLITKAKFRFILAMQEGIVALVTSGRVRIFEYFQPVAKFPHTS